MTNPLPPPTRNATPSALSDAGASIRTIRIALGGLGITAGVFAIVGSFGPWVTVFGVKSIRGNEGDGLIVALASVAAIVALAVYLVRPLMLRWLPWVSAGLFAIGAIMAYLNWANSERIVKDNLTPEELANDLGIDIPAFLAAAFDAIEALDLFDIKVEIGWGVVVATIAAGVGVVVSAALGVAARPNRD